MVNSVRESQMVKGSTSVKEDNTRKKKKLFMRVILRMANFMAKARDGSVMQMSIWGCGGRV